MTARWPPQQIPPLNFLSSISNSLSRCERGSFDISSNLASHHILRETNFKKIPSYSLISCVTASSGHTGDIWVVDTTHTDFNAT